MAPIIQANYETLQALAARFGQQAEATHQMAQAVQKAQQQLQSGGWIGRGSEAFNTEMEREVNPAVLRLVDALLQASQVTRQICQLLQGADEEASSPFRAGTSAGGANGFAGGGDAGNNGVWGEDGTYNPGAGSSDTLANIMDRRGFIGSGGDGGGLPSGTTGIRLPAGANDYGIPHDWLAGVNDSLKDYMNNNYTDQGLPSDWLSGVKDALGLGGGSGGDSSRMDTGGGGSGAGNSGGGSGSVGSGTGGGTGTGSGAGAGMGSGGTGGGTGGGMGSSGGSMGGGMGSSGGSMGSSGGGTGGGIGGGMPSDSFGSPSSQGGGFPGGTGSAGSAEGAAAQSAMRYQSLGGGAAGSTGNAADATRLTGSSSGGGGVPAADAAPSAMGMPIGIAIASPFLALLGKAIRKRSEDR
jgi:WXG100 family type VII secretion target